MYRIAIIPARGGSKRIPRKNVRMFCGSPMISYPVSVAVYSGLFDRVVVSTDDTEIAEIAQLYGADVPYMRCASLSDDYTTTAEVITDTLNRLNLNTLETLNDLQVCCLYATTPMLQPEDLIAGLTLLTHGSSKANVFAAGQFPAPVQRCFACNEQGIMSMVWPEYASKRTQDLPPRYYDAGQFYWLNGYAFWTNPQLLTGETYGYVLPRNRSVDIDTLEDWEEAEFIFKHQGLSPPERPVTSVARKR
ncbi:MAG: pseudaminic acid cytidylyltransferase [Gammaproteobacteria bacterium]